MTLNEQDALEQLPEQVTERLRNERITYDQSRGPGSPLRSRQGRLGRWLYRIASGLELSRNLGDYIVDREVLSNIKDKRVLELGCGYGHLTARLAAKGAIVYATDLSHTATVATSRCLRDTELHHKAEVQQMCAEQLAYADESFDMVVGEAILHHTELYFSVREISRVLVKGGSAIFIEPLGHNPIVNAWRRLTPSYRTKGEKPILLSDIKQMEKNFAMNTTRYFGLLSVVLSFANLFVPAQGTLRKLMRTLGRTELRYLTRTGPLKRLCVFALVRLTK